MRAVRIARQRGNASSERTTKPCQSSHPTPSRSAVLELTLLSADSSVVKSFRSPAMPTGNSTQAMVDAHLAKRDGDLNQRRPGSCADTSLRKHFLDDVATDVGQAVIAALEAERQFEMVQPQQVQQCGLQIVDVDDVFDRVVTKFVGLAD